MEDKGCGGTTRIKDTLYCSLVEYRNIRLEKGTVERLKKRGTKGETYDDIVRRLLGVKKND